MRYKLTMVMDATPVFPADDAEAARQNIFSLLKRLELSVLEDKLALAMASPEEPLVEAAKLAADEDLKAARQLLASLQVELVP